MTTAAVVGIGDISGNHLYAIADNPAIELVAVCDVDPVRADAAAGHWGVAGFTDVHEMLTTMQPDVVHITLPHHLHAPVAAAARAGCHVLAARSRGGVVRGRGRAGGHRPRLRPHAGGRTTRTATTTRASRCAR